MESRVAFAPHRIADLSLSHRISHTDQKTLLIVSCRVVAHQFHPSFIFTLNTNDKYTQRDARMTTTKTTTTTTMVVCCQPILSRNSSRVKITNIFIVFSQFTLGWLSGPGKRFFVVVAVDSRAYYVVVRVKLNHSIVRLLVELGVNI